MNMQACDAYRYIAMTIRENCAAVRYSGDGHRLDISGAWGDAVLFIAWALAWVVALAWAHRSGINAAKRASARRCPGVKFANVRRGA